MRSILIFFFIIFAGFAAGVYSYETQIASPAAALIKAKKKAQKKGVTQSNRTVNKSSLSVTKIEDTIIIPSRVVDLMSHRASEPTRQKEIGRSIKKSIKKSVSLDIQKAVVTEVLKQR